MKTTIIALILTLSSVVAADPVGGTATAEGYLQPGQLRDFNVALRGQQAWLLHAEGYGRAGDLDCFVYDEDGVLVGKDDDGTNTCLIGGRPSRTGMFVLRVRNAGNGGISFEARID